MEYFFTDTQKEIRDLARRFAQEKMKPVRAELDKSGEFPHALMKELGLQPQQTRYLAEFGHHGQNDQILSLELAMEEGRIKDGDVVLMISAGIGYAWNALVVRWGEAGKGRGGE